MKKTIYCPDITCGSCVKVLTRVFNGLDGVKTFSVKKDHMLVDYNEKKIRPDALLEAVRDKGYRADFTPFSRKTFKERTREFLDNKKKYKIEYTMLRYTVLSFFLLILLEILGYYTFFKQNYGFLSQYGWWIFYTDVSVVALAAAIWHFKSYRAEVSHMVGMMIGMTLGMSSGLLIGAILGATNGLFIGATTGMIFASLIGAYTGKCCGVMGVLEGLMAGLMGAMMGAMIVVMLMAEHLMWFMPVYVLILLIVIIGLSYMLFEEVVEDQESIEKVPIDFWTFFSYCFLTVFILVFIMLYGWKSAIVMVM